MLRFTTASRALPLLAALLLAACGESPTGSEQRDRIAFISFGEDGVKLHLINADGSGLRLVETVGEVESPSWSPDGQRIAFAGRDKLSDRRTTTIYTVRADGSGLTRFVGSQFIRSVAWSPDGRIAYVEGSDGGLMTVVSIAADGTDRRVLISTPSVYDELAWTRDGKQLAFANLDHRVCILTLADGQVTCMVRGFSPAWTPDGRVSFSDRLDDHRQPDLFLMNADGTGITPLTRDPLPEFRMSWSPDGERLVFERGRAGRGGSDLYIMNRDGSGVRQLPSPERGAYSPAWSPRGR